MGFFSILGWQMPTTPADYLLAVILPKFEMTDGESSACRRCAQRGKGTTDLRAK
jgi:hypothetical protein